MSERRYARTLVAFCGFGLGLVMACSAEEPGTETSTPSAGPTLAATSTEQASPAPAPSPTPPAPVTPEFRDFALQIDEALRNNDIEFFRERAVTERVSCTEQDISERRHLGSCIEVGHEFEGFPLAIWRSDGAGLVELEKVLGFIESLWATAVPGSEDDFGGPAARVHALGENSGIPGGPAQIAVVTALVERPRDIPGEGPLRVAFGTHWRQANGEWTFTYLLEARVLGQDLLTADGVGAGWVHSWEPFEPE